MTLKQNITSILECHFSGFKVELIEACVQRIMEQIERQADEIVKDMFKGEMKLMPLKDALAANPYGLVLEGLRQMPMFTGRYDAKHGNVNFMFGVLAVLEYIADKAGNEEYIDMFLDNMNKSVYGDKAE